MRRHSFLSRLRSDSRGNVVMIMAGGLPMLLGVGALAVDVGTFYVHKRQLQGLADGAALAAADITAARDAALSTIRRNGGQDAELSDLKYGAYDPDPALSSRERVVLLSSSDDADAVQISLTRQAPSYFGQILGIRATTITAQATAARINMAAFSLGSRVASLQGGLANAILSGLAGTELSLSVADYNALISSRLDVLRFTDALGTRLGLEAATFDQVLRSDASLKQVVEALADASPTPAQAAVLNRIAQRLGSNTVPLSSLIDLGPLGSNTGKNPGSPIEVDAYTFLHAVLEAGGSHQVATDLGVSIPGISNVSVTLAIGQRPSGSPWLAVSRIGTVTLRTAQARVLVEATVAGTITSGITSIRVPIYTELASATARLASLSCRGGRAAKTASLDLTPSLGQFALGRVDKAQFGNFTTPLAITPAPLVSAPLVSVTGLGIMNLGSEAPQRVTFTSTEIDNHTPKTVTARGLTQSVATSLAQQTTIQTQVLGLGIGSGPITSAVASLLTTAAPALDQVLDLASDVSGVRLGQADGWINGVRCGTPTLVL